MFEGDFESYRKSIGKYSWNYQGSNLAVFLLWEVLRILWEIGKLLEQGQTK